MTRFRNQLREEFLLFFQIKKTERLWHIPVLAALCVGIPLLFGLFFDNLPAGLMASLPGVVILYLPTSGFTHRLRT
ncbi:MAG: hypothetical protein J7501_05090, partial [Bdellovibrio sp.]|nr:hypothetical protein [Bdellovibrio sp.]